MFRREYRYGILLKILNAVLRRSKHSIKMDFTKESCEGGSGWSWQRIMSSGGFCRRNLGLSVSVLFNWRSTFGRNKYCEVSLCPLCCCPHSVVCIIFWCYVFVTAWNLSRPFYLDGNCIHILNVICTGFCGSFCVWKIICNFLDLAHNPLNTDFGMLARYTSVVSFRSQLLPPSNKKKKKYGITARYLKVVLETVT